MPNEINNIDIDQLYSDSLVRYKGDVVKVEEVAGRNMCLFFLKDRSKKDVKYNPNDFSPIRERIGYVNYNSRAVYVTRTTKRLYSIGITSRNSRFRSRYQAAPEPIRRLTAREIVDALDNKYPSIKEALQQFRDEYSSVAFDKQFAINYHRQIIFKETDIVGNLPKPYRSIERINWLPGKEHYQFLLELNYEKTVRTFTSQ